MIFYLLVKLGFHRDSRHYENDETPKTRSDFIFKTQNCVLLIL